MSCVIVIRRARPTDETARAEIVRCALTDHFLDAFLMFFFQELTLQCLVLCGAVLFIFAGASLSACCLLLPAALALVAAAVHLSHLALAEKHLQDIRKEMSGWVAEARGPLAPGEPAPPAPRIYSEAEARRQLDGDEPAPTHTQVVGTVSLSELWGPCDRGWVHALGVRRGWRRRGAARALLGAVRAAAAAAGLESLEAVTSALQPGARALLHSQGWELRGSYQRPVVGAALTLLVAQLGLDLPHA